jgi:ribosomal 50S subunit-associated protein YjgA (DUF615 family)
MNTDEIRACLAEKMDLFDKISANTSYQACFVAKRQLRSLGRLLREREALIAQLAGVDEKLRSDMGWRTNLFAVEVQALEERQQKTLAACRQVLNQASAEHMRIGAEMGKSRQMRMVKANYVHGWIAMASGHRLNVKG